MKFWWNTWRLGRCIYFGLTKTRALVEDFSKMTSLRPNSAPDRSATSCWDLLRSVEICSSVTFEFDHFGRPRFQNMVWNDAKDPYRLSKPARQFEMMQVRELPGKWWWWVRLMVDGSCSFIHGAPSSQACCGARVPGDSRTIQKRAQHDQQCESQSCKSNPLNLITSNHQAKHWIIESVQALLHTGLVSQFHTMWKHKMSWCHGSALFRDQKHVFVPRPKAWCFSTTRQGQRDSVETRWNESGSPSLSGLPALKSKSGLAES